MNMRTFAIALALLGALAARASETLLDIDFSSTDRHEEKTDKGHFGGDLPPNVYENYANWTGGRCTTELKEEGGEKFLRFKADARAGTVQFGVYPYKIALPGFFRLTVKGRVRGAAMGLGVRLNPAPYTMFARHAFDSPEWAVREYVFHVQDNSADNSLYLFFGTGETDLKRIVLERVDRAALSASLRRPPADRRVYVSRRFLLGLPNGWNDDRETGTATLAAVADGQSPTPVLRLSSEKDWRLVVWGEPFQTSAPGETHTLSFRCRGSGKWAAEVVTHTGGGVLWKDVQPEAGWQTRTFTFKADDLARAFAVKFSGKGELFLDDLRVGAGESAPPRAFPAECALAPANGEIAPKTRIWFADEQPRVAWAAADAPAGAALRLSVADLYGRVERLPDIPLKGKAFEKGAFNPSAAIKGRTGQFRVTAVIVAGGKKVSAPEEFIFTRIVRPHGWGRDLPESPFGVHAEPRPGTLAALKACGMNWARFHDAAAGLTGWWALEAEKGCWSFHDDSIRRFRENHFNIFAQLGTAPAWATHFHDLGLKNMGYFEKYLRPVDMDAWTNYVQTVVKRYSGVIDEYFVWNEPWGRWWQFADDAKYYDKKRTAQDFGEFQAVTYRALKAANPKVRMSGFNTVAAEDLGGKFWSPGVAETGGWDSCDIVDYHVYTPDKRGLRGDPNPANAAFCVELPKHPNFDGKPVYMSEGQGTADGSTSNAGQMSGLYAKTVPWEPESIRQMAACADNTCRFTLSLLAAGDRRVFLYSAHCYQGLATQPGLQILLGADGYPYPSLAAFAVFARAVEGRTFAGKADYGANGCVYTFRRDGAKRPVVKIYTELTPAEADALAARTRVRDLYGNAYDKAHWFPGTILYAFE